MNYPFLITNQSVVLVKSGKRLIAGTGHPNFAKIVDHIRNKRFNNIERLFDLKSSIEKCYNITIKNNNQISYKDKPLHGVVVDKILYFIRNGLPHKPIVKFLNNLMENPSEQSRQSLYGYLEDQKLPITEDGSFIGVKAISSTWLDKYSGKICNKVGRTVQMKREDVNSNPEECGHVGLHIGSADYVRQYGDGDSRYILVKINPRDVVVVPRRESSTYQKIRVCKYKVIAEIDREDLDFTSDYAPQNKQYVEVKKQGPKRDKSGRFAKSA